MNFVSPGNHLNSKSLAVPLAFALVYLIFPSKVSTTDGFGFAYHIKEGEKLFSSHHLLYNFVGFLFDRMISSFWVVDTLSLMKVLNSLAAGCSLFLLDRILKEQNIPFRDSVLWVSFVGATWGVMRFATENETYLLPICLSLLGSLWLAKFLSGKKNIYLFWAGLFTALAALFHQIHFFWWLGIALILLIKVRSLKHLILFLLPASIVPISYLLVFVSFQDADFSLGSFVQFVFRDYYSGGAELSINWRNFLLTPISFTRTFVQVHGYIYNLLVINWLYFLVVGFCFLSFFKAIVTLKEVRLSFKESKSIFVLCHISAFTLHFLFAFISHGNAEFMVMLPFLMAIVLSRGVKNAAGFLVYLVIGLLVWNMAFGLIPLSNKSVNGNMMVAETILTRQMSTHKSSYILFNRAQIGNIIEYYNDTIDRDNLRYIVEFNNNEEVKSFISGELQAGKAVHTDCVDRPFTVSRSSLLIDDQREAFEGFEIYRVDSTVSLSGIYYLSQLSSKEIGESE
jgi:hypothetical protein